MGHAQTIDDVVAILKSREGFFREKGVTRLAVFGSLARGDARSDSDVDLVIDLDPNAKFSLLDLVHVGEESSEALGRKVDVVLRRAVKPRFLGAIERDGVNVFTI